MTLDQTLRQFLDRFTMPDLKGLDWQVTAERLRRQFYLASHAIEKDAPEMADISHISVPSGEGKVKARVYTPLGAGIAPGPGILFFHGGGFVIGDLESHDMLCKRLAEGARCRVVSIDYRLAPEHKFPAAHEDALNVWHWVQEHAGTLGLDPEIAGFLIHLVHHNDSLLRQSGHSNVGISHHLEMNAIALPQQLMAGMTKLGVVGDGKAGFQHVLVEGAKLPVFSIELLCQRPADTAGMAAGVFENQKQTAA